MPTSEEWQELIDNSTMEWTTQNDVRGFLFTSNNNGNALFLPVASYYDGISLDEDGYGEYWTSSLGEYSDCAWELGFSTNHPDILPYIGEDERYIGCSVRAVIKP